MSAEKNDVTIMRAALLLLLFMSTNIHAAREPGSGGMPEGEKREFFIIHDYGMGGIWMVMHARSREEIERKYPGLDIVDQWPVWAPREQYESIVKDSEVYDIDEEPTHGYLKALIDKGEFDRK